MEPSADLRRLAALRRYPPDHRDDLVFLLEQVTRMCREQRQLRRKNLEPCCVSPVSSRVCERGVTGCVAKHVQEVQGE